MLKSSLYRYIVLYNDVYFLDVLVIEDKKKFVNQLSIELHILIPSIKIPKSMHFNYNLTTKKNNNEE